VAATRLLLFSLATLGITLFLVACSGGSTKRPATPTPPPTATSVPAASVDPPVKPCPGLDICAPAGLSRVYFIDAQRGWAIGSCKTPEGSRTQCGIVVTQDGGRTWNTQYAFVSLGSIWFLDDQHGFANDSRSPRDEAERLLRTRDGGETWTSYSLTTPLSAMHFVTPDHGFALGSGVIFQSTNGGATWGFRYGTPDCSFAALDFVDESEGWAAGGSASGPCLYHTTDAGVSWTEVLQGAGHPSMEAAATEFAGYYADQDNPVTGARYDPIALVNENCGAGQPHFATPAEGWLEIVCGSFFSGGHFVVRTDNGGRSWQYAWGVTGCLMGCNFGGYGQDPLFFVGADHAWRRASGHLIASTADGGETWSESSGLPKGCCLNEVFFAGVTHGWAFRESDLYLTDDGGLTWSLLTPVISGR
jgi:photosystem II stability/assembly factor-like uncharacterized protein